MAQVLVLLTEMQPPPDHSIGRLIALGVVLGSERMAELVRSSPAVYMAGVLLAAFEFDIGLRPRVAPEVAAVARDFQKVMDLRRRDPEFARWI